MPPWTLQLGCYHCGEELVIDVLDLRVQMWHDGNPIFSIVCLFCEYAQDIPAIRIAPATRQFALHRYNLATRAREPRPVDATTT